jgi:hypothetical protein
MRDAEKINASRKTSPSIFAWTTNLQLLNFAADKSPTLKAEGECIECQDLTV